MGQTTGHEIPELLKTCRQCGQPLPLCSSAAAQPLRKWACARCDMVYEAALCTNYDPDALRSVRPESFALDPCTLRPPPAEVAEFIRNQAFQSLQSVEKRAAVRHPLIATVAVLPLNRYLLPDSAPFLATTRDISTHGIGMLHLHAVTQSYLAVDLKTATGRPTQVITLVMRSRPRGPFHDIAGQFVTRTIAAPDEKRPA